MNENTQHDPQSHDPQLERCSALADGELVGPEADQALDGLLASAAAQRFWTEMHAVGDSLRSEETGAAFAGDDFLARFSMRLAAEPALLVPSAAPPARMPLVRRYGLPGAAIAAAVALVLFTAAPPSGRQDLAVAPPAQDVARSANPAPENYVQASHVQPQFDAEPYFELHRGVQAEPAVRPAELLIVPSGTERQP